MKTITKTLMGIKILPRDVILDVQGRAIEKQIREMSEFAETQQIQLRVGKYIEMEVQAPPEISMKLGQEIAQKILINPLIEKFEIECIDKSQSPLHLEQKGGHQSLERPHSDISIYGEKNMMPEDFSVSKGN